ncbi:MAG: transcription-repair coupling factor [Chloroflexota bacterium]
MDLSGLLPLLDHPALASAAGAARAHTPRPVLGVPDGAKAAVIAALARDAARPLLVVTGKADSALTLAEEVAAWLGVADAVLHFPELDLAPYEHEATDSATEGQRLAVLQRLRAWHPGSGPLVVVAGAWAVSERTIAPDAMAATSLELHAGMRLSMRELLSALERLRQESLVEAPGQAARRGGIVDVFVPGTEHPVRIELLGDRIDSLRAFDPATQRTVALLTEARVLPAREAQATAPEAAALRARLDFTAMQHGLRARLAEALDRLAAAQESDPGFYAPFLAPALVLDHLPTGALVVLDEPTDVARLLEDLDAQAAEARAALEAKGVIPRGLPLPHATRDEVFAALAGQVTVELRRWAVTESPHTVSLPFGPAPAFGGRLRHVLNEITTRMRAGTRVVLVTQQAARVAELVGEEGLPVAVVRAVHESEPPGSLTVVQGTLRHGWQFDRPDGALLLLTDSELFGFTKQRRQVRRTSGGREAFLSELSPGDYVVHVEHGIARFVGLTRRAFGGAEREYLELHYAEGDRLFVPADQLDRVSRYVGPADHRPQLSRLGSGDWARTKERVRRAVTDLAQELLQLYAAREVLPGHAFSPDTAWQQELEASFPYVETPDQLAALREIKADMERPRPMDRIVVGDVGYGKTELAVRAAFKAVMDGKQVAVLVPTTVLAQQHYQTFTERMSGFPVRIEVLSRFRSEREQRDIVSDLAAGRIDILIGTHRILQADVHFKDLGLVIVDEEQRFGVVHKERLKELRREVDVLTLSATPIPRTLHMSLSGIRDMSTLETAPEDRLPIKTFVTEFDERLIREAILRELDRGGQVYFVHNRVYNIELIAERLRRLVPEAEIAVAHGQMPEEQLERVMLEFQKGAYDVLVCTTIIESGLDIPTVNTIIINQADKLGLAQLYQLRGRVGRGAHRAYAYLLYDRHHALSEPAQKRLQAIFEASELGAGFQIALRDLEIRGAGNLLGAEQSGHMGAVGYELYSQMLAEAVRRMRALLDGQAPPPPSPPPITIDLPFTAHIPETYVADLNLRLSVYQRLAQIPSLGALAAFREELQDRFGTPPPAVENLLYAVRVRLLARSAGLQSVTGEEGDIVLRATGPIAHRERLRKAFEGQVQVGSTQVRLPLHAGWREVLLQVLERLQPDWRPSPTDVDYGTFAVAPRARQRPPSGMAPGRLAGDRP